MIRILITNFHPNSGGGHDSYIRTLININKNPNFTIGVAVPQRSRIYQYLKESGYPYIFACDFPSKIQKELPSILRNISRFKKIIADFKPDVVHANGAADLSIAAWSYPLSSPFRIVRTHHALRNIRDHFYHRWLYQNKAQYNIYVSQSAFEISTSKGLFPSNHTIIKNGVDTNYFSPIAKNAGLMKKYGIDDDCVCFGSCAGTANYKRVDLMIKAAILLKEQNLPHKFKILVLGDEDTGNMLQKLANENGLDEFIYGGFQDSVKEFISLFDVGFILSDSIETISFAAREMMSMGKPLISSSFSGLKENVRHGVNGLLVEPGNIKEVKNAMKYFLEIDKKELNTFSKNEREYAVQNFGVDKQMQAHIELYEKIYQR